MHIRNTNTLFNTCDAYRMLPARSHCVNELLAKSSSSCAKNDFALYSSVNLLGHCCFSAISPSFDVSHHLIFHFPLLYFQSSSQLG